MDPTVAEALADHVEHTVEALGGPGVAVGVADGDERHFAEAGVTSIENPLPVTSSTLFQVGSITKTITAAAVMLLVEDGLVSLDDAVFEVVPSVADIGADLDEVTVEQLLNHTMGIDGDHLLTHGSAAGLGSLAAAARLFDPGTGFSYNNAAFSIAGALVSALSARRYEDFVAERILGPLGMSISGFRADGAITRRVAAPHATIGDETFLLRGFGWQKGWELDPVDRPAAGLISSTADLLRWAAAQWGDGGVLSPTVLERLHTPVASADGVDDMALDWFVRDVGGTRSIRHGGVTVGYVSELVVVPARRWALVVLTNSANGDAVIHEIRSWAMENLAGLPDASPTPPDRPVPLDPAVAGRYLHSFAELELTAGTTPGTIEVRAHRRSDADELWQPPANGAVSTWQLLGPTDAVSVDAVGTPELLRWGVDNGRAWLQWRGRRALRID